MDGTQPPVGAPSDPKRFRQTPEMSDEDKAALKKKADSIRGLKPKKLEPEQKDFDFDGKHGYDSEFDRQFRPLDIPQAEKLHPDDPFYDLLDVARRHFPKR